MQFSKRLAKLYQAGLLARLGLIFSPMALLLAIFLPVGFVVSGNDGMWAVLIACGSCLAGGLLSTVIGTFFRGPEAALQELLMGMLFRMGVPLGAAMFVMDRAPAVQAAGFVYYLIPFFLVGLSVHAAIAVGLQQGALPDGGAATSGNSVDKVETSA